MVLEKEPIQKRTERLEQRGRSHMAYVEMAIDSTRHAKYRDEWVVLLREKAGQRYLPVYVDRDSAHMMGKALKGEKCDYELEKMLATGDEISLVIDGFDKGVFHAEFIMGWCDKPSAIKCSIGKVLALCVKASAHIFVEETVLNEAGIATKP